MNSIVSAAATEIPKVTGTSVEVAKGFVKDLSRDVICSMIQFPRTSSLEKDKPAAEFIFEANEVYDYSKVEQFIETNVNLISLDARDDLQMIIQSLKKVHDELHLDNFDCIQIFRCGIDLLRITNKSRDVNRSAFIEINEYKRRLHHDIKPASSFSNLSCSIIFIILYLGLASLLIMDRLLFNK